MSSLRCAVAVLAVLVPFHSAFAQESGYSSAKVPSVGFARVSQSVIDTLFNFDGTDASLPYAALVQGFDGNLYETTEKGGPEKYGNVIKITQTGVVTLHRFCSVTNCNDGAYPIATLTRATNGILYGATQLGGVNDGGTVFSITEAGELTTLYNFCAQSNCTDGYNPSAVIEGIDGNFYGTTFAGGANNQGSVFKLTPQGALTTLYSFCTQGDPCPDGAGPGAALVQGTDGSFYGTNESQATYGFGTIFKITASGELTTLHTFGPQEGTGTTAALIQAGNGNFYGTTETGGPHAGGSVYEVTPSGSLTTLYDFCAQGSPCIDGASPIGGVLQASDGNFYGTTVTGGTYDYGTVFRLTPAGKLTSASFPTFGGIYPYATPTETTDGTLYGTTFIGGFFGDGTLYRLAVALRPFIQIEPMAGNVGSEVEILGQGFTASSVVKFGGVEATSVQLQGTTELVATVPTGAITGPVTVTTGSTTLTSLQQFRVGQ